MKTHPDLTQIEVETFGEDARILVIDDEPTITHVVSRHLRRSGYKNIRSMTDSRRALHSIALEKPDLILLDLHMPHLSGLDLLRQIRENPEFSDIIVLILSAASNAEKYKSLNLGAVGFISKPVDAEELGNYVSNALRLL